MAPTSASTIPRSYSINSMRKMARMEPITPLPMIPRPCPQQTLIAVPILNIISMVLAHSGAVTLGSQFLLLGRPFYLSYIWCMKTALVGHPSYMGHYQTLTWGTVSLFQSDYVPDKGNNRDPGHWCIISGHMVAMFDCNYIGMQSNPALLAGSSWGSSMCCKLVTLLDGVELNCWQCPEISETFSTQLNHAHADMMLPVCICPCGRFRKLRPPGKEDSTDPLAVGHSDGCYRHGYSCAHHASSDPGTQENPGTVRDLHCCRFCAFISYRFDDAANDSRSSYLSSSGW